MKTDGGRTIVPATNDWAYLLDADAASSPFEVLEDRRKIIAWSISNDEPHTALPVFIERPLGGQHIAIVHLDGSVAVLGGDIYQSVAEAKFEIFKQRIDEAST